MKLCPRLVRFIKLGWGHLIVLSIQTEICTDAVREADQILVLQLADNIFSPSGLNSKISCSSEPPLHGGEC